MRRVGRSADCCIEKKRKRKREKNYGNALAFRLWEMLTRGRGPLPPSLPIHSVMVNRFRDEIVSLLQPRRCVGNMYTYKNTNCFIRLSVAACPSPLTSPPSSESRRSNGNDLTFSSLEGRDGTHLCLDYDSFFVNHRERTRVRVRVTLRSTSRRE